MGNSSATAPPVRIRPTPMARSIAARTAQTVLTIGSCTSWAPSPRRKRKAGWSWPTSVDRLFIFRYSHVVPIHTLYTKHIYLHVKMRLHSMRFVLFKPLTFVISYPVHPVQNRTIYWSVSHPPYSPSHSLWIMYSIVFRFFLSRSMLLRTHTHHVALSLSRIAMLVCAPNACTAMCKSIQSAKDELNEEVKVYIPHPTIESTQDLIISISSLFVQSHDTLFHQQLNSLLTLNRVLHGFDVY